MFVNTLKLDIKYNHEYVCLIPQVHTYLIRTYNLRGIRCSDILKPQGQGHMSLFFSNSNIIFVESYYYYV